jgi:DNA-binding response OmpR family regulator
VESSKGQLLVVEDDPDSRALFGELLADAGIDAVCVDHQALPERDGFGLVMTDLPGKGRFSIAEAREWTALLHERYRAPIVIVTGRHEAASDEVLRRSALMIEKPVDIDELLATIRGALDRGAPADS